MSWLLFRVNWEYQVCKWMSLSLLNDGNSSKQSRYFIPMTESTWLSDTSHNDPRIETSQYAGSWISQLSKLCLFRCIRRILTMFKLIKTLKILCKVSKGNVFEKWPIFPGPTLLFSDSMLSNRSVLRVRNGFYHCKHDINEHTMLRK